MLENLPNGKYEIEISTPEDIYIYNQESFKLNELPKHVEKEIKDLWIMKQDDEFHIYYQTKAPVGSKQVNIKPIDGYTEFCIYPSK